MTTAYRPLDRLATATQLCLAGHCALSLFNLIPQSTWDGIGEGLDEESLASSLFTLAMGIGLLAMIAVIVVGTFVCFLMWLNRAAHNVRALIPGATFEFTPGWAVGWWFVPFANLIKPFQATSEIAKASLWAATGDRKDNYASSWMAQTLPALFGGWWAMWIISNFCDRLAMKTDEFAITFLSSVLGIGAAVACILVVRTITEAQRDAHARTNGSRFADGTSHIVG